MWPGLGRGCSMVGLASLYRDSIAQVAGLGPELYPHLRNELMHPEGVTASSPGLGRLAALPWVTGRVVHSTPRGLRPSPCREGHNRFAVANAAGARYPG